MNSKQNCVEKEMSYPVEETGMATKRVCLALDLKNDPELIKEYIEYHSPEGHWTEIADGIRQAGVVVMDIFHLDTRLFMICEVPADKDVDSVWENMGRYPRQMEWAKLMEKYQQAIPGHGFGWVKMERIYNLFNKNSKNQ